MFVLWQRELNERFLRVDMETRIAAVGRVPDEAVTSIMEEYRVELFETRYSPAYIRDVVNKKAQDVDRLKALDKLTIENTDLPPPPTKKGGGRRGK